jgi:fructose-specific component phosphotransferase system IIB-like protein
MQLLTVHQDIEIGEQLVQMAKDLIKAAARRKQQKLAQERRERA